MEHLEFRPIRVSSVFNPWLENDFHASFDS
jgi:hypothetical protein